MILEHINLNPLLMQVCYNVESPSEHSDTNLALSSCVVRNWNCIDDNGQSLGIKFHPHCHYL